jgi:xanthine dehydrogenase YagS FAD-binding subunit
MQPFALIRTKQLAHARELILERPELRELRAGGIDLLDRMKEGLDEPELLVELRELQALAAGAKVGESTPLLPGTQEFYFPDASVHASIGALTTLAQLANAPVLDAGGAEALTAAAGQAATPSIRNTATVGGNLLQRPRCWYFRNHELLCLKKGGDVCLALMGDNRYNAILGGGPSYIVHPSSLATPLLALDAVAQVYRGPAEDRGGDQSLSYDLIAIADLFVGPKVDATREHSLGPGDVLMAVWVPMLAGMRSA